MVGLFASLKWRLVTNRLRHTTGAARLAGIAGFILSVLVLALIVAGLVSLRTVPDLAPLVITGLYTLQLIMWVLTPLVAFGVDETVDPQRFALLPIAPQDLQRGLLASSLVGYLPMANLVVVTAAAIAVATPWGLLPLALLCAAVQLITCVVFSRAAATSMSALMSSRRGRDLGMAVGFAIFVGYMLLSVAFGGADPEAFASGAGTVARALSWAPPGSLAALPANLAAGAYARATIAALIALTFLAIGWWWWGQALRRSLTTAPSTTENAGSGGRATAGVSVAGSIAGTARLVAERDRILAWRDPMRRMPILMSAFLTIVWPFLLHGEGAVFAVVLGAVLLGAQSGNQFAIEGSGLWLHMVAFADRARARGETLGHALVALVPAVLLVAVGLLAQGAFRGAWALLPAAAGVCFAALGGAVAAACVSSAYWPYAMPQSRKSVFASSAPGQKGRALGVTLVVVLGGAVGALPAAGLAVRAVLVSPAWGWLALLVGLAVGAAAVAVAPTIGAARYLRTAPELFAIVAAGDRS